MYSSGFHFVLCIAYSAPMSSLGYLPVLLLWKGLKPTICGVRGDIYLQLPSMPNQGKPGAATAHFKLIFALYHCRNMFDWFSSSSYICWRNLGFCVIVYRLKMWAKEAVSPNLGLSVWVQYPGISVRRITGGEIARHKLTRLK